MSGQYFGRLIATGEWGVCLLSLDIRYMMFFGVNVQEIDKLRRKKGLVKNVNRTYGIDDMKLRKVISTF